ncbi:PREDICTED: uncharacterized protein LOC109347231 isoform X2 [Lupinus angustifolius]|uniref:uncharacterized protein LOC109347231 isoform X2 n=1 Tax=Lupinus angustifolius TaxID=3871 RepID=UPI00092FCE7F|nr:PREDICTED: uncharacterized protein LOC109347231 isoform X2 [Lupinus angustifolius]
MHKMEHTCSCSDAPQNHSSDSDDASNAKFTEAEIAWYNMRSEWVGDRSKRLQRQPRVPIERGSDLYEEILLSACYNYHDPYKQSIALAEILSFFGDFWGKDKLYISVDCE